jgi:hypothetical protein
MNETDDVDEGLVDVSKICHDCYVLPGKKHEQGCDVEHCMLCGHQAICCDCIYVVNGIDPSTLEQTHPEIYENGPTDELWVKYDEAVAAIGGPEIWTGEFVGSAECREFGWYNRWLDAEHTRWETCKAEAEGARPALDRLSESEASGLISWSREKRRWMKSEGVAAHG